jgi:hypothetical protein
VVPLAVWDKLFRLALRVRSRRGPMLVTQHERPKFAEQVGIRPDPLVTPPRVGIVIQGPPFTPDDFTIETVRLYRQRYPDCPVIASTWADTPPAQLKQLAEAGAAVVTCDKPADPGYWNVNLQLTSALAGVKAAAERGVQYVLKTRSDQRIYAPNALEFLANLLRAFPPVPGAGHRGRVVGIGSSTTKYNLYQLSDQTVFGYTADMLIYWSAPCQPRSALTFGAVGVPGIHPDRYLSPETYLATQFLARTGRPLAWTLADSWRAFADHFCAVDPPLIDLYWAKAGVHDPNTPKYGSDLLHAAPLTFVEWLNLATGLVNKAQVEVLGERFKTEVNDSPPEWFCSELSPRPPVPVSRG